MSRTRLEKETTIVFNEAEDTAMIWSASEKIQKRLLKSGFTPIDSTKDGKKFLIPKKLISIRKGNKPRTMTDEQRKASSERLANARMAKEQ